MATSETGPHGAVRADDAAAPDPPGRLPRPALLAALALGIVALVVEHLVRGNSYWDYSEGVYLFTSRQLLHGADLYGTVVVAQPPPLFALGAGLLSIQDSLEWMRWAIGALQVGTGLLAATVVWRLTASRAAAAIAAPLVLLTPWAVHEHGSLIPEMIVAPLLLGGVLMAPQARRAPWLGLVAALLPAFKLSYALPALVLIALSADWRRTARWALAAAAAEIALTAVFFGAADVWRNTVQAQFESGHISAHALVGVWAQIAWNLSGLLIAAALAWALRRRTRDRRTLVVAGATAGATLLTLASTWKLGTSLNSLVPSETALVPLAVAGCAWAVEGARKRVGPAGPGRRRAAAVVGALGVAFAVAQGVALVAFPHVHGAHPFLRPGSAPGYGITLSADEVDAAVRAARSCPAKIPYSGTPIIAFIADRPLPADQPDQYLAQLVPVLRPVRDEILAVKTRCPREAPATH
jgi:hypothetical protein